jgi:hypothetical protein
MKTKHSIFIISFLTCALIAKSQNSVVVSGKAETSIYGSISFTIGQVLYTQKGETYNLSEGNQQPHKINPIENRSNLHVSVYPNPSKDFIYFLVEDLNFNNLNFQLTSISGKLIRFGKITNQKSFVQLSDLKNGVYILKIIRGTTEEITHRVLKLN